MSIRTAALHTPSELAFVGADDATGIVTFTAPSKSRPATPNTVSLDTTTGAILCDCKGAECGQACWHGDHIMAAWLRSGAMLDVLWLTDAQLARYGAKLAGMVRVYRARTGRVLQADQVNLVAARSEWRARRPVAALARFQDGIAYAATALSWSIPSWNRPPPGGVDSNLDARLTLRV